MNNKMRVAISVILSVMMLVSVAVMATPTAVADDTVPAAKVGEKVTAAIGSGLAGMANDGWKHYYTEFTYYHYISTATEMPSDDAFWYLVNNGGTITLARRMDKANSTKTYMPWGNISQIVYTGKTFKNFEINAQVYYSQHSRGNDTPLYIGFGKTNLGVSMFNTQGGYTGGMGIAIGDGGNVALVERYSGSNGDRDNKLVYTTSQSVADNTPYNVRVVVLNGVATVYVNDAFVTRYTLRNNTEGYVSFGGALANASGFSKFEVTEIPTPDVSANVGSGLSGMAADGWTHYYHESYYYNTTSAMKADSAYDGFWYVNTVNGQKMLARKMDAKVTYATKYPWGNISQIVYTGKTFKNFEINATILYSNNSSGANTPLYIGFGKKNTAYSLLSQADHYNGGMGIAIGAGGNVALVSGATYPLKNGNQTENGITYTTSQTIPNNTFYDVNVKVLNGVATVKVNDVQVAQYTLPRDSEGYVSLGGSLANVSGFARFDVYALDSTITTTGGVTADKTRALAGEKVTVTVPAEKHLVAGSLKLSYGDVSYGIIEKADSTVPGEGTGKVYSFIMPDADVTVSAELKDVANVTAQDSIATVAASVNDDLIALRFLTRINLEEVDGDRKLRIGEKLYYVKSVGTLILPENMVDGELTLDSANVTNIPATGLYDETTSYIDIKGGIKNLKSTNRERNFTARGYLIYVDDNGVDQIVYANAQTVSYRNVGGTK